MKNMNLKIGQKVIDKNNYWGIVERITEGGSIQVLQKGNVGDGVYNKFDNITCTYDHASQLMDYEEARKLKRFDLWIPKRKLEDIEIRLFQVPYYRHFKGKWYKVLTTSKDVNDESTYNVIYESLYNHESGNTIWNRELHEFLSYRDKDKYPDEQFDQKYRFSNIYDLIKQYGIKKTKEIVDNEFPSIIVDNKGNIYDTLMKVIMIAEKCRE